MAVAKIRQFQLIRTSLQDIVLKLVVKAPLDEAERRSVTLGIHEKLLHDFDVEIVYADDILREPSGKYREFKSELASSPATEVALDYALSTSNRWTTPSVIRKNASWGSSRAKISSAEAPR